MRRGRGLFYKIGDIFNKNDILCTVLGVYLLYGKGEEHRVHA